MNDLATTQIKVIKYNVRLHQMLTSVLDMRLKRDGMFTDNEHVIFSTIMYAVCI